MTGDNIPPGLLEAVAAYDPAAAADDVAFRARHGRAVRRTLAETHVQVIDADSALVVAVTELAGGGRDLQTQLWRRHPEVPEHGGWRVTAAHVSAEPSPLDTRIWRVVGDPLVRPTGAGPLTRQTVAVKDLYAVAGQPVGAGNPKWLAEARAEPRHAATVAALLAAGAAVRGIARTDELAYSLAGTNPHYGAPPNPQAPYRIPGGSSSGSASAVALGHATIGLGTDTGGSIRVPAAYQGLFGIRTTHGAVDRSGLLPLAPTFDAVGWLTRSPELLRTVGDVLLPPGSPGGGTELVVVDRLVASAHSDVAAAVRAWTAAAGARTLDVPLDSLDEWRTAFQTWQAFQAWRTHGPWLSENLDALGEDVRSRFAAASRVDDAAAERARAVVDAARTQLRELVADRVLALPSTPSVAPSLSTGATLQDRNATMRLTCLAAVAGLPAVSIPVRTADGLPAGVCLVAGAGRDRELLDLVVEYVEYTER